MSKRTFEAINNSIEIPDPNSLEGGGDQEEVYEGSESILPPMDSPPPYRQ